VLFSVLFAQERPTAPMVFGFVLIFVSILCSETKFSFLRRPGQKSKTRG
jgi:drug/metabolite transporter (DMT)-like permease